MLSKSDQSQPKKQKVEEKKQKATVNREFLDFYVLKFQKLIDKERQEEKLQIQSNLQKLSRNELKKEGLTIFGLSPSGKSTYFSKVAITFSIPNSNLPFHTFTSGESVTFSKEDPLKENVIIGTILSISQKFIKIVFDDWFPPKNSLWRMDKSSSEINHERMTRALDLLYENPVDNNQKGYTAGSYLTPIIVNSIKDPYNTNDLANQPSGLFQIGMTEMKEWKEKMMNSKLNESQCNAILNCLNRKLSLIQGPPGTGKTHTSISLIQLCLKLKKVKILATAYTNVAVDNLLEGLLKENIKALRIGQPSKVNQELLSSTLESKIEESPLNQEIQKKEKLIEEAIASQSIDKKILLMIQQNKKDIQVLKKQIVQKILSSHDVICSTCVSAGHELLQGICFPFVLIDEASQSVEPATIIPIMKGSQQVVLVGDHHQLPPTVTSFEASKNGLSTSLFERMIECGLKPEILLFQYRMHPYLSVFPSHQFYRGVIKNGISRSHRKFFEEIEWVSKEIPIIFYQMETPEETVNKSKINAKQAEFVSDFVYNLLEKKINPDDIGVISPYLQQVNMMKRDIKNVEIKSIDGFQGREKELIIISTVRCNKLQGKESVGFLSDWKRLNVAITRAKRGLIIVGDQNTLQNDNHWKAYLSWLNKNNLVVNKKEI